MKFDLQVKTSPIVETDMWVDIKIKPCKEFPSGFRGLQAFSTVDRRFKKLSKKQIEARVCESITNLFAKDLIKHLL